MSEKDTRWEDALEAIRAGREEMRKKRALRVAELEVAADRHRLQDRVATLTKENQDLKARLRTEEEARWAPRQERPYWRPAVSSEETPLLQRLRELDARYEEDLRWAGWGPPGAEEAVRRRWRRR